MIYSWDSVAASLVAEPAGTRYRLPKCSMMDPRDAGFRIGVGLPVGQQADYRSTMPGCRGLHVQDFGTHYEVHIDRTDPSCDLVRHLAQDAPGTMVAGAAAAGALVAVVLGRTSGAVLAGAALGALLGCAIVAAQEDAHPQSSTA